MNLNGFSRREVDGLAFYVCRAMEEVPSVRHAFSTRRGGVSPLPEGALNLSLVPWDLPSHVESNRKRFLTALGLDPDELVTLSQAHSGRALIIDEAAARWNRHTRGDALITSRRRLVLGVQVADCFAVLMADPATGAVAGVHAGWRGVLAGVLPATVEGLRRSLACDPTRLLVAIGPGIRACCMEVGSEVADRFDTTFPGWEPLCTARDDGSDKHMLDLPLALKRQLGEAGIAGANVHDLGACTRCGRDEFFSYRGEGPQSGRMMGVIARL